MKLTKDEAAILYLLVKEHKYDFVDDAKLNTQDFHEYHQSLSHLEQKLKIAQNDKRRHGRTTQNDYSDLRKRFVRSWKIAVGIKLK